LGWCQAIPFPLCELQSKWIAGVLSNRFTLPSQEEMMEDVEAFYSSLEASGTPKRYTHCMGANLVSLAKSRAYNMTDFHFSISKEHFPVHIFNINVVKLSKLALDSIYAASKIFLD
jgi:hypothetical protein